MRFDVTQKIQEVANEYGMTYEQARMSFERHSGVRVDDLRVVEGGGVPDAARMLLSGDKGQEELRKKSETEDMRKMAQVALDGELVEDEPG